MLTKRSAASGDENAFERELNTCSPVSPTRFRFGGGGWDKGGSTYLQNGVCRVYVALIAGMALGTCNFFSKSEN